MTNRKCPVTDEMLTAGGAVAREMGINFATYGQLEEIYLAMHRATPEPGGEELVEDLLASRICIDLCRKAATRIQSDQQRIEKLREGLERTRPYFVELAKDGRGLMNARHVLAELDCLLSEDQKGEG